ncbi:polysaccharide deacetylase family protein [Salipaludibacillus daqingensis]|uniref:polysaccharide deacetylase family protein n=1 Tax=Salipaludibacillus daqingensis TaxID=3041001 RepID=UPI00247462A4|nr:polysaccharide deacetylase family protein [Salipaludibacillus daqingensis]
MKSPKVFIITILLITTAFSYLSLNYFMETTDDRHSSLTNDVKTSRSTLDFSEPPSKMVETKENTEQWRSNLADVSEWGEFVSGVKSKMETDEKVIALTFDACGGPFGNEYDEELIQFLREEEVPATLFFNARWIKENEKIFLELADDPLFSVQNHGTNHLPLSVNGKTAWGIQGTSSVEEVIDEVMDNQILIEELTGETPKFFRSGTAFYDDVAVEIVQNLGLSVVNFDILGDAGATYTAEQVEKALLQSTEGSIPLLHMNQPNSETAEGVANAIPILEAKGYTFILLDEKPLRE